MWYDEVSQYTFGTGFSQATGKEGREFQFLMEISSEGKSHAKLYLHEESSPLGWSQNFVRFQFISRNQSINFVNSTQVRVHAILRNCAKLI